MQHTRSAFVSLVTVLLGIGVLMVCSSSMTARPTEFEQIYLWRHLAFLGVAITLAFVTSRTPPTVLLRLAPLLFAMTTILLVIVLIPGLGTRVKGSQRWLRLGPVSLQPSEFAKLTLPLFLCWMQLHRPPSFNSTIRGVCEALAPVALVSGLVLMEPDLGTATFLMGIGGLTLYFSGFPLRRFAIGVAAAVPVLCGMVLIRPYQLRRIEGFLNAWSNFQEAPYQVKQSLTTIGAGGILGVGLGRGWQKLSFLPEANTDFVFAVVGEELGLVGTLAVIAIWMGVFVTGIRLLTRGPAGNTRQVVGLVLLTQIVFQAAVNIAVVSAMLPPKGIAHPLLSVGGSSLVSSLLAMGVILSMSTPSSESSDDTAPIPTAPRSRNSS